MTLADRVVLVVEDHAFQRRTMVQMLANLGVGQVLEADDGAPALAALAGTRVDAVVCDLDLPGMHGLEFLRELGRLQPGTGVVIATGLEQDALDAAATTARDARLAVLAAVQKPLTARVLQGALARELVTP
jgi:CheY-like chemotaxis protein